MLIKNSAVAEDRWVAVDDDADLSGEWPIIVSLARWRKDRAQLEGRNAPLGIRLSSDDPLDEIVPDLDRFFLIALDFPAFTDGRPYSTARLLRERHGYTGELRAVGQVLRDQAQFLTRCGFDSFELPEGSDAEDWLRGLDSIAVHYQPASDGSAAIPEKRIQL
ncbi:MAG: DUF934 domain-containing protein [Rhodospirillaceae bacterium]|nr:DUF934 domain-containing protein [Rhodospirillaceae bacterium]MDD9914214.1 DUF934 domain-containing protein [Rhodospirillaceae bacterium]MDD9925194.1 DUF934 domain-containing protein [Rhodospirillaceae bacterium]